MVEKMGENEGDNGKNYENTVIICNSKGVFRKENIKPLVGDIVEIGINHSHKNESEATGIIEKITERKNFLIRPPIANIDALFIVAAVKSPAPAYFFIDKITAIAVNNNIEPVIIINKIDLADGSEMYNIYKKANFTVIKTSAVAGNTGFEDIKREMNGKVCAFAGASGVGKSTLLNGIFADLNLNLETNTLSEKIERGRHTTRTVELFKNGSGYVADTPGFSVLDFEKFNYILKGDLLYSFPDLCEYADGCKYTKCTHTKEDGCNIIKAAGEGNIAASRHESYVQLYEQVKNQKEWEIK
jgi:ribosome biogenesis GTPase